MSTATNSPSNLMSNTYADDVDEFHEDIMDQYAPPPHIGDKQLLLERLGFMHEELQEFNMAAARGDIVLAADALADLVYVALGTAYLMGIPFNAVWTAVQKANMTKQRGMTKRGNAFDAMKPIGWVGPETEIFEAITRAALA